MSKSAVQTVVQLGAFEHSTDDGLITFRYQLYIRYGRPGIHQEGFSCNARVIPRDIGLIIKRSGPVAFAAALAEAKKRCNQQRQPQPWAK